MSVAHPVVCNPVMSPVVRITDPVGWRAGKALTPDLAILYMKCQDGLFNQIEGNKNPFLSSVLPTQYVREADGSTRSTTLNMLTNSGFVGAVSGTPGVAPTGWTTGNANGTLVVNGDNSLTISATANMRDIRQTIAIAAYTKYPLSVVAVCDGLLQVQQILSATAFPAGVGYSYEVDNVPVTPSTIPSIGKRVLTIILNVGATAGSCSFVIGVGAASASTGTVTISNPQLTEDPIARPYVLSPVSGPAYGDVVDVIGGEKWLRTCGAVTNILTAIRDYALVFQKIAGLSLSSSNGEYTITRNDGSTYNFIRTLSSSLVGIVNGMALTFSCELKANTKSIACVRLSSDTPATPVDRFFSIDLTTGAIGVAAYSNYKASVENIGNGWLRLSLTNTSVEAAPVYVGISIGNNDNNTTNDTLIGDSIKFRNPQLTATAYPVPYTPPGTTMPASHATTTGGPWFALPQYDDAETADGLWKRDGVELYAAGNIDVATTTAWSPLKTMSGLSLTERHIVEIKVSAVTGGNINVFCQNSTDLFVISSPGIYKFTSVPNGTQNFAITPARSGMTFKTDSISIQKLIPATKTSQVWAALDGEPDGVELLDISALSASVQNSAGSDGAYVPVTKTLSNLAVGANASYPRFRFNMGAKAVGTRYSCRIEFSDTSVAMSGAAMVRLGSIGSTQALTKNGNVFSGVIVADNTNAFIEILTNGTALWSMQIISATIQRIKPSPMTLATRVMMGVGSGDLPNSTYGIVISPNTLGSGAAMSSYGISSIPSPRIYTAYDGTTVTMAPDLAWARYAVVIRILQVNTDGTQYRLGYVIEGTHTTIQWGSWVAFDGSFGPSTLFKLMLGYNNIYPMWFSHIIMYRAQIADSKLITDMGA